MAKMAFLTANSFFQCVFKNTDQKDICVSIVFTAESKPKHKEKKNCWGFPSKTKNAFFRGSKILVFKTKILNLFFCVSSLMKMEASCPFSQKNNNI